MFHQASPRLRAWLEAFAGERPELHDRFDLEIHRLRAALQASEFDRAARLGVIQRLQRQLDELGARFAADAEQRRDPEAKLAGAIAAEAPSDAVVREMRTGAGWWPRLFGRRGASPRR